MIPSRFPEPAPTVDVPPETPPPDDRSDTAPVGASPTVPPSSGVRVREGDLVALSSPPPPSVRSELPAGYRRSRSSGARVMLGITANPWKRYGGG